MSEGRKKILVPFLALSTVLLSGCAPMFKPEGSTDDIQW